MNFKKIKYSDLNAKAKEMYNFQKASAKLADYGYTTMWLNNDWEGADFLAIDNDGSNVLKVQLKARLTFSKKYLGKNIHMCFPENGEFYLFPHDEILEKIEYRISDRTWVETGSWSSSKLSKENERLLEEYKL